MEDGHVIRRALEFESESQWKKGRLFIEIIAFLFESFMDFFIIY